MPPAARDKSRRTRLTLTFSLAAALTVAAAGSLAIAACGTVLDLDAAVPPLGERADGSDEGAAAADGGGTDATAHGDGASDAARGKLVFVTTAVRNGAFGGVDAGDDLCNAEARASGLSGSFVAYLQHAPGAGGHPATRVGNTAFERVDGVRVFDGNPQGALPKSPVDLTSDAGITDAGDRAWTGIYNGPSAICGASASEPWTTTNPPLQGAGSGDPHAVSAAWSAGAVTDCNRPLHLYCFER